MQCPIYQPQPVQHLYVKKGVNLVSGFALKKNTSSSSFNQLPKILINYHGKDGNGLQEKSMVNCISDKVVDQGPAIVADC